MSCVRSRQRTRAISAGPRRDHPPVRVRIAAAILVLGIVAAGCSSATPDVGIVKGVAWACVGPPDHGRIPRVTVTAEFTSPGSAKGTVAATTTANANNGGYELQLRPGTYLLSAPESGMGPSTITVTRGKTLIANFSIVCS
jgi:hypothetical protein